MLGAKNERLDDAIVRFLGRNGVGTVNDIQLFLDNTLAPKGRRGTPAIYKALRNLVKNEVVVHRHGCYQLSHTWLFQLAELIESSLHLPLSNMGETFLPSPFGRFSWRYSDLRTLNVFTSHLITSIAHAMPGTTIFAWTPHPWFNLAQESHEKIYYQALKKYRMKVSRIVGGDYPLDLLFTKRENPLGDKVSFIGDRAFLPRNYYIVVIGDYIIKMRLSKNTANSIDALFMRTTRIEQIDIRLFQEIFRHMRNPAELSIENNKEGARKLSEKFQKYLI